MAEITKVGAPTLANLTHSVDRLPPLVAGEAIGAGDACYIKTSDGKVYKSTGAAANAAAKVRGYAAQAYANGEAGVTLFLNPRLRYGTGLSPGANLYLSGTVAGGLADATSTGGTAPIGFVVDDTRVQLFPSTY